MPNCDFYALPEDVGRVMEFVFRDTECRVYHEWPGRREPPRQYGSPAEVVQALRTPQLLNLFLYADSMGGEHWVQGLDGISYTGWGTILLQLEPLRGRRLSPSNTRHNSEKRALKWAGTYAERGSPARWNWAEVARISRKINRFIRVNLACSRSGSRAILPAAHDAHSSGTIELALN